MLKTEKDINNLVAQYLRKEGYEVHSYYTYEEASAHVADDDVHLWILDIMLDDKSGFDLIEEIVFKDQKRQLSLCLRVIKNLTVLLD